MIFKQTIRLISFLTLSFLLTKAVLAQTSATDQLAEIRALYTGHNLGVKWENISTNQALSLLNKDGSFSDGKPNKKQITGRLMQWAIDYQNSNNSDKTKLREAIGKSLQYWLDHRPKYTFPSIPFETLRAVAAIELVIFEDLTKDRHVSEAKKKQVDKLIKSITEFSHWCWYNGKSPCEFDKAKGHNRGGNVGYRLWAMTAIASCSGDIKEMDWVHQIVKEQFPRVLNTTSDLPTGFTPDGSWIQHNGGGAQNYWIGYGVHWINHVLNYANATQSTKWKLTSKEWHTLADYYIDGIQWYYYKNNGALNLAGRHNALKQAPINEGRIQKEISRILSNAQLNSKKEEALKAILSRYENEQTAYVDSTKYFWNTDLLIHSTPKAYFAIKMLSNRTTGCETSESERAHGKNNFLSGDGTTIIYHSGQEYNKARIAWNWRAWPGISALQKEGKLPLSPWGYESKSLNQFAGGLSTGKQGLAAFHYNRKNSYVNLQANKAYFTFGNKMLALGNSIKKNEADSYDVWTSINQTERKGPIHYHINDQKGQVKAGKTEIIDFQTGHTPSWIYHDNTAYIIFPNNKSCKIKLIAETRTGKWSDLDGRYWDTKDQTETRSIFQLALSHGAQPDNADYAYMVIPGIERKSLQNYFQTEQTQIIQNNALAQAIQYDTDSYMVVFYKKGQVHLHDNLLLEADQATIVHLTKKESDWHFSLADPLHQQEKANFKLTENKKTKQITITFPNGMNRGKSIKSILNSK